MQGNDVGQCDFDLRQLCIEKEIIKPRSDKMVLGALDRTTQAFSVRIKQFWDVSTAATHNVNMSIRSSLTSL